MIRGALTVLGIALLPLPMLGDEPELPPAMEAVRKHLLGEDFPELIDGTRYVVRIERYVLADVDNDGHDEVVLHFNPHFRQSPTIGFYRVSDTLVVTRAIEGLAPGPLQPISGDYIDGHTLGHAVDFSVAGKQDQAAARESLIQAGLKQFGGLVMYPGFFHADSRAGDGMFLDMNHVASVPVAGTCEKFEFSKVREIAVGPLDGGTVNYLAAWVGDEIYLYLVREFRKDGRLDKQSWIREAPAGFGGFLPGRGLRYLAKSGAEETLSLPSAMPSNQVFSTEPLRLRLAP